jgi:hypothetical protein
MNRLAERSACVVELLEEFDDGSTYKGVDSMDLFYTGRRIEVYDIINVYRRTQSQKNLENPMLLQRFTNWFVRYEAQEAVD